MEDQVAQLRLHCFQYFVNEQHEKVKPVPNDSNQNEIPSSSSFLWKFFSYFFRYIIDLRV